MQLFIPPIYWRGDPIGHIGIYDTFFLVVDGECCFIIDDNYFIAHSGDLVFMPKGKMRAYANMTNELTLYEINFQAEINGQNWHDFLSLPQDEHIIKVKDMEEIKKCFEESVRYELNKNPVYDVMFCINIGNVLKEYIIETGKSTVSKEKFARAISYMKNNLDHSVKIKELAESVYMQPTYFVKKFKESIGDTPITYLNKLRIYKAMRLLAENSIPLSEICHAVGIYDSSYFSKTFKAYTNVTPTEYRDTFSIQRK